HIDSLEVAEVSFPPQQLVPVLQGGRILIYFPSQHGGVVVSFASLRNNLRRTMASRAAVASSKFPCLIMSTIFGSSALFVSHLSSSMYLEIDGLKY
ncbi:hypothetical protein L9F63_009392, partial [Diploptera punctata]